MRWKRSLLRGLLASFLTILCLLPSGAETLVNWECGFEVQVPPTWLRLDLKETGLKLSSDEVRMHFEPYFGITQSSQIKRLHQLTKEDGFDFKTERDFTLNGIPAHEMIFYRDGDYKIYYVMIAGNRGFLCTLHSRSTDSPAFLEGQDIIASFTVKPI